MPPTPDESTAPSSFVMTPPVHILSGFRVTMRPRKPMPWIPPAITSLYQTVPRRVVDRESLEVQALGDRFEIDSFDGISLQRSGIFKVCTAGSKTTCRSTRLRKL